MENRFEADPEAFSMSCLPEEALESFYSENTRDICDALLSMVETPFELIEEHFERLCLYMTVDDTRLLALQACTKSIKPENMHKLLQYHFLDILRTWINSGELTAASECVTCLSIVSCKSVEIRDAIPFSGILLDILNHQTLDNDLLFNLYVSLLILTPYPPSLEEDIARHIFAVATMQKDTRVFDIIWRALTCSGEHSSIVKVIKAEHYFSILRDNLASGDEEFISKSLIILGEVARLDPSTIMLILREGIHFAVKEFIDSEIENQEIFVPAVNLALHLLPMSIIMPEIVDMFVHVPLLCFHDISCFRIRKLGLKFLVMLMKTTKPDQIVPLLSDALIENLDDLHESNRAHLSAVIRDILDTIVGTFSAIIPEATLPLIEELRENIDDFLIAEHWQERDAPSCLVIQEKV